MSASEDFSAAGWSYDEAFKRNLGLINPEEQTRLRNCRVAVAGLGGVGGIHLAAFARLGIGRYTIADPDVFETCNANRQYGCLRSNVGRPKADVMAEILQDINPEAQVDVIRERIGPQNAAAFLTGADVLVDGIDFFSIEARRMLFREARQRGIWAVTAAPLGFSTSWLTFDPGGMTFDRYFDIHDDTDRLDQLIAFYVGLAPAATHLRYLDLTRVDLRAKSGPSAALACHLASGVAAAEVLKIVLRRGPVFAAPYYFQFDAYRYLLRKGRLRGGNRHPWQRFKRWWLRRRFKDQI